MSELLQVNHIFKVLLPCGRGCAVSVELVSAGLKTFEFWVSLRSRIRSDVYPDDVTLE